MAHPPATETAAETLLRSEGELDAKTRAHTKHWGFGRAHRWDADLDQGLIWFTHDDGRIISAPVQIVGSYSTEDSTWLWAWDNRSVDEPLTQAARLARAFGVRHGLDQFTQPKIQCTEDEAWTFTALAVSLSDAWGAYRGPSGSAFVYMAFGEITLHRKN